VLSLVSNLASLYYRLGRIQEAIQLFDSTLKKHLAQGEQSIIVGNSLKYLGAMYLETDITKGIRYNELALAIYEQTYRKDHSETLKLKSVISMLQSMSKNDLATNRVS
jgi:tetratricopeptide (TPR) repeat protein